MIVDDELDLVRVLKIYLEKKGFQVDTFTDAIANFRNEISTFNAHPFDLMVVDFRMPRMNGFELYNKIKEHDSCVKVCFMTALDELQEYNCCQLRSHQQLAKGILFKNRLEMNSY